MPLSRRKIEKLWDKAVAVVPEYRRALGFARMVEAEAFERARRLLAMERIDTHTYRDAIAEKEKTA